MEAIVLAGGFGTRLKNIVSDVPKPMAPIGETPFLSFILEYLFRNGVQKVILSTGYKHDVIESYFGIKYKRMDLIYSVENQPLGTGGAIKLALNKTETQDVFVLNGDTFFQVDLNSLYQFHQNKRAKITLSLKALRNFDRYGTVTVKSDKVASFHEKKSTLSGIINGGVYLVNKECFNNLDFPQKFSFETDFLEPYVNKIDFYGYMSDGYFIDIGVPEDYYKAKSELGEFFE
ncbi:nucleotidyltransferase family protein [Paenibacillus ehimensis]|uniref:nucleotidyltransferase family protein n=1 Tax=Paenibacillus ehimensis TaxID=79264 RepID=UPI00046F8FEC|nr:nucleotidyltransferase family protein [Paenibacillus ehimensis]